MDLSGEVVARPPEVLEPDRFPVHPMQAREHVRELVIQSAALDRRDLGEERIGEHAAMDTIHQIERCPDDRGVFAEDVRARHRHAAPLQRGDDAILAIDRVRGRQELARRLPAQHVLAAARADVVRRVRLPALELAHVDGPGEPAHALDEIALQRRDVDAVDLAYGRGVGRARDPDGHGPALYRRDDGRYAAIGYPRASQALTPPRSAATRVKPRAVSFSA